MIFEPIVPKSLEGLVLPTVLGYREIKENDMAKLWIGNKLYSVENEVQDYCDKQDERIELFKSRVEQLEYTEICEDCSAKTILPEPHGIGCKAKERIKELELAVKEWRQKADSELDLNAKLHTETAHQAKRIKELEEELDDYHNTEKFVLGEDCPTDENHCGCVVILKKRIKVLEAVIQAALRISDLWTLKEVETMFEDEAKALELMKQGFERALKG